MKRFRPHCGIPGERATDRRDHSRGFDRVVGARAVVGSKKPFGPRAGWGCSDVIRGTAIKVVHHQPGRRLSFAYRSCGKQWTGDAAAQRAGTADGTERAAERLATERHASKWGAAGGKQHASREHSPERHFADQHATGSHAVRRPGRSARPNGQRSPRVNSHRSRGGSARASTHRSHDGFNSFTARAPSRQSAGAEPRQASLRRAKHFLEFGVRDRVGSAIGCIRKPRERRAAGPRRAGKGLQSVCVARHERESKTLQSARWARSRPLSGAGTAGATEGLGASGRNRGCLLGPRRPRPALVQSARPGDNEVVCNQKRG